MEMSAEVNELFAALAKAQAEMNGAQKKADNPFFKSKYADLAAVQEACREPLAKNGLSYVQTMEPCEDGVVVLTTLGHSSGQWIRSALKMKPVKNDPQGIGSVITYARRYSLAAIVGVPQVDDDAEAGMGRNQQNAPVVKIPAKVKKEVYEQSVACLENGDEHGLMEIWSEFDPEEKAVLWSAFNSQQRSAMKELMKGSQAA